MINPDEMSPEEEWKLGADLLEQNWSRLPKEVLAGMTAGTTLRAVAEHQALMHVQRRRGALKLN